MINKLKLKEVFYACVIFMLAGCGARYQMVYTFFPPHSGGGQACVKQCERSKANCHALCEANDTDCEINAKDQAQREYERYVKQKKIEGAEIMRDLKSFYDPLQCSKTSCDCEEDFRACYQMCGGKVKHEKRCIANCGDG